MRVSVASMCSTGPVDPLEQLQEELLQAEAENEILRKSLEEVRLSVFSRPAQWYWSKLQALVYDILSSATAVFSYAIGLRKLSANEQFFVGAQTVVRLSQTTQIKSDVSLMLSCCLRQLK